MLPHHGFQDRLPANLAEPSKSRMRIIPPNKEAQLKTISGRPPMGRLVG